MAYKIQYTQGTSHRYPQFKKNVRWNTGKWAAFAILIAVALWMRFNGIPDFLIPGDPGVTKAAAAVMIDDIQTGIPVGDAVTAFCREIMDGAGL